MSSSDNRFREPASPGKYEKRNRKGEVEKSGFNRGETQALRVARDLLHGALAGGGLTLQELEPTHLNRAYQAGKALCRMDAEAVEESYREQSR